MPFREYCQDILKYKSSVGELCVEVTNLTTHVQFVHKIALFTFGAIVPLAHQFFSIESIAEAAGKHLKSVSGLLTYLRCTMRI